MAVCGDAGAVILAHTLEVTAFGVGTGLVILCFLFGDHRTSLGWGKVCLSELDGRIRPVDSALQE
jgi:hypothetical protein